MIGVRSKKRLGDMAKSKIDKSVLDAFYKAREDYFTSDFQRHNAFYNDDINASIDALIYALKEIKKTPIKSTGHVVMALQEEVKRLTEIERNPINVDRWVGDWTDEGFEKITPFLKSLQPNAVNWTIRQTEDLMLCYPVKMRLKKGALPYLCYFFYQLQLKGYVSKHWATSFGEEGNIISNGKPVSARQMQQGRDQLTPYLTDDAGNEKGDVWRRNRQKIKEIDELVKAI